MKLVAPRIISSARFRCSDCCFCVCPHLLAVKEGQITNNPLACALACYQQLGDFTSYSQTVDVAEKLNQTASIPRLK